MRKNVKCDGPALALRVLCIIIIALLLIMIVPLTSKSIRYHHYGEKTVGKETEIEHVWSHYGYRYKVEYVYEAGGKEYRRTSSWIRSVHQIGSNERFTVWYDKEDPSQSVLEKERDQNARPLAPLFLALAAAVWFTWSVAFKKTGGFS